MRDRDNYSIDVVVPCFNEQESLPHTAPIILSYMRKLLSQTSLAMSSFQVLLVDDGSTDATWPIINNLVQQNPEVIGIKLSRNYGHQNALLAGLSQSNADASISIDADLQDEIEVVEKMLRAFEGGADLALGVRSERNTDTRFKRNSANLYYRVLSLLGVRIVENHADYRLMSKKALAALLAHGETNLFLRGIIPSLGFSTATIPYSRLARTNGETKYTIFKMMKLAADGITSFSIAPLRFIAILGALMFVISGFVGTVFLGQRLFAPHSVVPGWASTVLPLLLLGGMQLLSIGVLGEYVGRIYMEVKRRPRFIIETNTSKHEKQKQTNE